MIQFFQLLGTNMRSIIAISVVWLSFIFLIILVFHKVPEGNQTIINVAAGLVLAALGGVIGYYFGSSKDKSDKEKAEIAMNSSASVETTISKDKNEPE